MAKARGQRVARVRAKKPAPMSDRPNHPRRRGLGPDDLTIESLRFVRVIAETTNTAFAETPEKVSVAVGFTRPRISHKSDQIAVLSVFQFRLMPEPAGDDAEPLARIVATAELLYRRSRTQAPVAVMDAWVEQNSPFHAWPYWRELVQSALVRLGLPVFRLPLLYEDQLPRFLVADEAPPRAAPP